MAKKKNRRKQAKPTALPPSPNQQQRASDDQYGDPIPPPNRQRGLDAADRAGDDFPTQRAECNHDSGIDTGGSQDQQSTQKAQLQPSQVKDSPNSWRWWVSGWRLLIEAIAIPSFALTIYSSLPVLSATLLADSGPDAIYGANVAIVVSGVSIRDVVVQCATNKVIFNRSSTAEFDKFASVKEYSVGNVKRGESFTVGCAFAWTEWTKENGDGAIIFGRPDADPVHLAVLFNIAHRKFTVFSPHPVAIGFSFNDALSYREHPITAIDAGFIIHYKLPMLPIEQKRVIHMIESEGADGLKWRVAPEGEPIIPDPNNNHWHYLLKSDSKDFAVKMQSLGWAPKPGVVRMGQKP